MDHSITTNSIEDAEDLFLLAKDRLLDVNEWDKLSDTGLVFSLTDSHKQKLHRSAHSHDLVRVTDGVDKWYVISGIIYDDFPDIAGETVTLLMHPEADDPDDNVQSIIIKRVGKVVAVSAGNFILADASFLKGIIATGELV